MSCLRKKSFASPAVLMLTPTSATFVHDLLQRSAEVFTKAWIAPDAITWLGGIALRYVCDRNANHHRHHRVPFFERQLGKVHIAHLIQNIMHIDARKLEARILAQYRIRALDCVARNLREFEVA